MARDIYRDRKSYHFANKISDKGDVSALCFKTPRPINLKLALWTLREEAVTCPLCVRALKLRHKRTARAALSKQEGK